MASLAYCENLAGKVQMIYMDPPYGIKFSSNFQLEIGRRDVKDRESDLTREPEMVKAYRDTWTLGVHSYLTYLRDRLYLCKELLADTGSIFVQISDENLHRVRCVMDEVFGGGNFLVVVFKTTTARTARYLSSLFDFLRWYAKDTNHTKYRQLFEVEEIPPEDFNRNDFYGCFYLRDLSSQGSGTADPFEFAGQHFSPSRGRHWSVTHNTLSRLAQAERIEISGSYIRAKVYHSDFPVHIVGNVWVDTQFGGEKYYAVQTHTKVVQRCLLMTTDPGDLVLDPTCGSGTTAYVAEQWGRRWITIDTSRVAIASARQRLLTATYPMYKVRASVQTETHTIGDDSTRKFTDNPANGFVYKTVPHITLKSIAQNVALDAIFAKHQTVLDAKLAALNAALKTITSEHRRHLAAKLLEKEKREGKRAITDADRRRWILPKDEWKEWEVPFDTDEDWTPELKAALTDYRTAWRAKMDEVNACIAASAEQEELVDQPEVVRGVVRVSGPFTVEAVMPAEESLDEDSPIEGAPEELETFDEPAGATQAPLLPGGDVPSTANEPVNAEAYLDKMLRLLRTDGVRFPNNKVLKFTRLEPYEGEYLHAEGEWETKDGQTRTVAVSFGPQFGPVTAFQVENVLPLAMRRGFEDLVFAGFSFDGAAQVIIQDDPNPRVRCHLAHIRPDVNMGDLLKETPNSQIFTVFGSPRTELHTTEDGMFGDRHARGRHLQPGR